VNFRPILIAAACVAAVLALTSQAQAGGPYTHAHRTAMRYSANRPWHGAYTNTSYGVPVALVVPPTSHTMASWGWGVTSSEIRPIYHQFGRYYPGELNATGGMYLPTPAWPSHTDQFGIYPVRGPW
jgi:hypothetical protein